MSWLSSIVPAQNGTPVHRAQLSVHGLTKRYDDRAVLDAVDFSISPGEKVGVIGDNGSGKSTLLRILAGREPFDDGEATVVAPGGVGFLSRGLALPLGSTVQVAIDVALAHLRDLEARMRAAERALAQLPTSELTSALDGYADLTAAFESGGGYDADARVDMALHGLGLPHLDRSRRLDALSGGEQSRLALAATLAADPELLLLDEPTNDLDDDAIAWLETHLRTHRGTVIAVTHDRTFLDQLTSVILEIDAGTVTRYGDGYDGYLAAKAAERRRRSLLFRDWRAELGRNERLVATNAAVLDAVPRKMPLSSFGHGAFRARGRGHGAMGRIRNAKQRVERLTDEPVSPPAEPLVFTARVNIADPRATPPAWVAELDDVAVEGRLSISRLHIGPRDRLLVSGPNGAGKSTLMRLLASELKPGRGAVHVGGRVGHLRQAETTWPVGLTAAQAFAHGRAGSLEEHMDMLVSMGLFRTEDLGLRVEQLSFGQRRRIELARVVAEPVDLLLLDEPTNHLAPALVEELEGALVGYQGAVVLVTHDRRMRQRFSGARLRLDDGRVVCRCESADPADGAGDTTR